MSNTPPSKTEIAGALPSASLQQNVLTTAQSSGILFFGTLFEYSMRFILGILMARFMGAEQYGLYSLAYTAFPMISGLVMLGLDVALVRYIPIFASRQDRESLRETLQVGLLIPLILSVLGAVGLLASADPVAGLIFHEPRLAPVLRVVALGLPFSTLLVAVTGAARGFNRMQDTVIARDISVPLIKLLLAIALVAAIGLNAINMMTIDIIGQTAGCLVLLYFLHKLFPLNRPWRGAHSKAKEMFRFSLPLYGSNLIGLFGGNLQTLLLGALSTVTAVGIFTVAGRVSWVIMMFQGGITIAAMPIVSALHSQGELRQLGRFYQTMTKWILAISLPLFLIVLLFPKPLLSIFGDEFVAGSTVLIILSCGTIVDAGTGINSTMISMTGNTWLNILNTIITLVLRLILSFLLIPRWGAVGAAITMATGTIVLNLIRTLEVFMLFRLWPYNKSFIKPVIAVGVAAIATTALVQWVFVESNLVSIGLNIGFLLAVYVTMTLILGLSEEDRVVLTRLHGRLKAIGQYS